MPSKKNKSSASNVGLQIDGELCFDKSTVAERFNSIYTTVASKLVKNFQSDLINLENLLLKNFTSIKVWF